MCLSDMGWVAASNGLFLVDDADEASVRQFSWFVQETGYVIRTDRSSGRKTTVRLHRWLMGLERGDPRQVDHRNGLRGDCRRLNLRVVTAAENAQNLRPRTDGRSKYRGVSYRADRAFRGKRWRAYITVDHKRLSLGTFATEKEAAEVAEDARKRLMPFANQ